MSEVLDVLFEYVGKAFSLLGEVPLVAGVSLGSFLVFLIVLETVIHLVYNHESVHRVDTQSGYSVHVRSRRTKAEIQREDRRHG